MAPPAIENAIVALNKKTALVLQKTSSGSSQIPNRLKIDFSLPVLSRRQPSRPGIYAGILRNIGEIRGPLKTAFGQEDFDNRNLTLELTRVGSKF
jgi:hypothetical protein